MDRRLKFQLQGLVIDADCRLEGADEIADNIFRGIMQQGHQPRLAATGGD